MLTENEFLDSCEQFLSNEVISKEESWSLNSKYLVKKNHIRKRKEIRKMEENEEEFDAFV
jgi:hypothetical protein